MSENKIVVAVKGMIFHEGKYLIIQRSENDEFGAGTWEFPGGKMDFGEWLEDALIREVKEEVGLAVTIDKILYATSFNTDPTRQVVIITYLCHSNSPEVILSGEHNHYKWVTEEEFITYLTPEIIKDLKNNDILKLDKISQPI